MKKAKIMLSAIAIMGIAGGALAFKAKRGAVVYCAPNATSPCNITVLDYTIHPIVGDPAFCTSIRTVRTCPLTKITRQL